LEQLLAEQPATPHVAVTAQVDEAVAAQAQELERRGREMIDLRRQLTLAQRQVLADRQAVEAGEAALAQKVDRQAELAADEGFQSTLAFYESMPAKQAKDLFLNMDEPAVATYLAAMKSRSAGKIVKEFKQPDERDFLQRVMAEMRSAESVEEMAGAVASRGNV
jgi:flagellar motility protein MotE (MotC chaperone)